MFSLIKFLLNKSNSTDLPVLILVFINANPSPTSKPNIYPVYAPVIPIIAYPYFANAIVTKLSGKAFPIAITVIPKYVVDNLLNIPKNVKVSINIPLNKYIQINDINVE